LNCFMQSLRFLPSPCVSCARIGMTVSIPQLQAACTMRSAAFCHWWKTAFERGPYLLYPGDNDHLNGIGGSHEIAHYRSHYGSDCQHWRTC
jgi:hypothetical protein